MLPWCTLYQGASVTGTLGNLTSIRLCLLCIRWMDRFALCGVKGQPNSFTLQYIIGWYEYITFDYIYTWLAEYAKFCQSGTNLKVVEIGTSCPSVAVITVHIYMRDNWPGVHIWGTFVITVHIHISCCHYSAHLWGQSTRSAHLGDICHSAHIYQLLPL